MRSTIGDSITIRGVRNFSQWYGTQWDGIDNDNDWSSTSHFPFFSNNASNDTGIEVYEGQGGAIDTYNWPLLMGEGPDGQLDRIIVTPIEDIQSDEYIPSYGCDLTYTRQLGTFKVVGDFSVEEADIDIINNNFMWFGADFSSGNIEVLD